MKKSFKRILVLAASLILALCMAVPVFADLDQTTADNLKSSVQQFLEQVYTMDEDTLQQMKSSGGFYEVFYNSWEESRDEVERPRTEPSQLPPRYSLQSGARKSWYILTAAPCSQPIMR